MSQVYWRCNEVIFTLVSGIFNVIREIKNQFYGRRQIQIDNFSKWKMDRKKVCKVLIVWRETINFFGTYNKEVAIGKGKTWSHATN